MAELGETISEAVERAGESRLNSTVAILVALAATFVALMSVKDRVAAIFLGIGVLFGMAGFLNWNLHVDALMSWLA